MARKVFISFLGTTNYYSSEYYRGNDFCSKEEKYVQIAALEYIQTIDGEWTQDDIAYILLTEEAKKKNWVDNGHEDKNGNTLPNSGLESVLRSKGFPFACETHKIPEGKDETEIWEIFKVIYSLIKNGDRLYFDITHGFRYLPMLIVVLGNYAKFLKKVKVKHIIYGNYEGRDKVNNNEYVKPAHSPLVDLQPFSTLQDWTYAVADFINNGNADRMFKLADEELGPRFRQERASSFRSLVLSIRDFAKDMQTCRGKSIIEGEHIREVKKQLNDVYAILTNKNARVTIDELLIPVFERIQKTMENYNENGDVNNGFHAAKWCIEHRLYQQAVTILQESVKNYFLFKLCNLNMISDRDIIEECLYVAKDQNIISGADLMKNLINKKLLSEKNLPQDYVTWMDMMKSIASDYGRLCTLRNDFNHFGCKNNPATPSKIEGNIKNLYASITKNLYIQ